MRLPKKTNYNSKPYPSVEEVTKWSDFVSVIISIVAFVISLIVFLK